MRLVDYLDKGAQLGAHSPCLTLGDTDLSYAQVQRISWRVARGLRRAGVRPGDKVAVLSSNDAMAFATVFGISRAGCVWCPINPRNEASENAFVLDAFDCACLLFHGNYADMVDQMRTRLPKLRALVCLDARQLFAPSLDEWLEGLDDSPLDITPPDDVAMIAGTGGTTGQPKGVMLSGRNLEAMSALTLMGYPFEGRPAYLALAPLTHAAGVLCLPVMALGGRVVIMPKPDLGEFLGLIEARRITHTFLPPTLIYMLLQHPQLASTQLDSLQCFWYGAAPMSATRLEEALQKIGPVMAQLFGQTEAPMMISMMSPREHFNADGTVARHRLSSAGRPGPLVQVGVMNGDGALLPAGENGEIVVRGSLVMQGYYKDARATEEARRFGWHHTGDIGYLDADGYLYIVDRAKDMIISGGFNVYSAEVEQALMQHPDVQDSAVVGLPDEKWGERVVAVLQLQAGRQVDPEEIKAFVKSRIGSVKAPKQIEVWLDLPRSKVGKVLKKDVRSTLLQRSADQPR
ncbi:MULTISPECIES: acyl-CoA synthetase [Variovorax]|jgi:fatty-acyl-CoA synthase|uniref:acyl-CoA synthetase n=1 Tax=Variovorax TaxID=34072 RepID=UPI00086A34E5|nr:MULTISPECIES: long-chain fatty acid--CoA ligase [Variovorax]MBN8757619.1 long-chain fatty acid--CoA ligase [Variovorax sp.]ODU13241.1 MAG: AMP-dependent acyl-CoA synthetase [Variovorax sp. SCN 67-85]ODV22039.1 MAG: AMP-dependent acyl-CoA synthetase [Variovorax sp. SCN 67-20]OJZ07752.1 MAG: AMP-dependent acyl-CoA synthetase [Variovorax sp. 67-131]UKI10600.1 long-chain fatty acid--CoA ligase [Variovorax paradoxus]